MRVLATKLHITNGDAAGDMLKASSAIEGDVLCWRDVLHDGPITVLEGAHYHRERAAFLWSVVSGNSPLPQFDGSEFEILKNFEDRALRLNNLDKYDELVLWFEHDLYDQLQLAECLYHLAKQRHICDKTRIICIGDHSGVPYFHGLGNLSIVQMEDLYPGRKPLVREQLQQGSQVWHALSSATPDALQGLLGQSFSDLPYMRAALRRFAQEYPSIENGLTRTQHYILQSIATPLTELPILQANLAQQEGAGHLDKGMSAAQRYEEIMSSDEIRIGRLFVNLQTLEQAPFLGDTWLIKEIDTLARATVPYINLNTDKGESWNVKTVYKITEAGLAALEGNGRWGMDNDYDLWRGGVHITNNRLVLWDDAQSRFMSDHPR